MRIVYNFSIEINGVKGPDDMALDSIKLQMAGEKEITIEEIQTSQQAVVQILDKVLDRTEAFLDKQTTRQEEMHELRLERIREQLTPKPVVEA